MDLRLCPPNRRQSIVTSASRDPVSPSCPQLRQRSFGFLLDLHSTIFPSYSYIPTCPVDADLSFTFPSYHRRNILTTIYNTPQPTICLLETTISTVAAHTPSRRIDIKHAPHPRHSTHASLRRQESRPAQARAPWRRRLWEDQPAQCLYSRILPGSFILCSMG